MFVNKVRVESEVWQSSLWTRGPVGCLILYLSLIFDMGTDWDTVLSLVMVVVATLTNIFLLINYYILITNIIGGWF